MSDAKRRSTQSPNGSDESASCTGVPVYELQSEHRPEAMPQAIQEQIRAIHETYEEC